MSDAPVSPKANRLASPTWLDTRLVLGVLLVLVSVVVGARVLSAADRTQSVWAATRDLAAGTTISEGDLVREEVRLSDAQTARLLRAPGTENTYVGTVLSRPVGKEELVPLAALRQASDRNERQFTLNVAVGHRPPDLKRGQVVDVYVTPGRDAGQGATAASPAPGTPQQTGAQLSATGSRLVLSGVTVDAVAGSEGGLGGGADSTPVVLNLAPADVLRLVTAVAEGQVDLVRVRGAQVDPATGRAGTPSPSPATDGSPSPDAG